MKHQTQAGRSRSNVGGQHSFAQIPSVNTQRSSFNRSHGLKTTFDAGYLIPVFVDEALPGDTMSMKMTSFARMATPLHPVMDNMKMEVFFFSVPNRLLWENWQRFCGEQTDPADSTDFLVPTTKWGGSKDLTIWDYMGLPMNVNADDEFNVLPFRAYNLIWNEWFRDENLQDSETVLLDDGPDTFSANYSILRRGKRHDYFTSSLPWPQKGPAVELPLGLTAPVVATGDGIPTWDTSGDATVRSLRVSSGSQVAGYTGGNATGSDSLAYIDTKLEADLSSATAATINQIREAFQIQKLYERDARGGTRYTEIIRSHFGVTSPDARLQRPEYLGGGSATISVNPVAQTSNASNQDTVQGNLTAFVTSANTYPSWTKSFTEHCTILGLVSIRADLNYQEGINRMWLRQTRWDYFWPALAHIGEQAVENWELHTLGDSAGADTDHDVWGYQERWAEYRYKPSMITGQFRSSHATSLDTWHLAQDFASTRPLLNATFIEDNPPVDRVIAVSSEPHFLLDAHFQYTSVRPMPTYSVPGLIDHF